MKNVARDGEKVLFARSLSKCKFMAEKIHDNERILSPSLFVPKKSFATIFHFLASHRRHE